MFKGGIINTTKDGVATKSLATRRIKSNYDKSADATGSQKTLDEVLKMHTKWLKYRKKLLPGWERDTKLYNNERVTENRYSLVSDTFVPMTFSTIETMVAAIVTGDLSTDFIPQDIYKYLTERLMPGYTGTVKDDEGNVIEETEQEYLVRAIHNAVSGGIIQDESLEVLNALYDYYYDAGDWDIQLEHLVRSGLKIANGAWWLTWKDGKACLETVPFPDYIFDPDAVDDDSCMFVGRRRLASLSELKNEEITDPATGKTRKRYSLKGVTKQTLNRSLEKMDKEFKESILFGSTSYDVKSSDDSDQVELIELVTADNMYAVVNRTVLAESTENPFKAQARLRDISYKKYLPGITWSNYKDESLLVGMSETSTFWKEQERLNDATNQKSDAVTVALLQQHRADPALKAQAKSMSVPGAVIWATMGQYEHLPPAQVPGVAFTEEVSIKNNIREVTATDQIVKGVGSTTDVTATEAKLQVAQSGQRIDLKIRSLEKGPLKQLARKTLYLIRLFVADPFIIPQRAANGIKPILFDPKKYQHDFDPKVTLTINAEHMRRQEQSEARENYKMLIADPTNDLEEVKKLMLPKMTGLDKDEINRIIKTQTTPAQPETPGASQDEPQAGALPNELPVGQGVIA